MTRRPAERCSEKQGRRSFGFGLGVGTVGGKILENQKVLGLLGHKSDNTYVDPTYL